MEPKKVLIVEDDQFIRELYERQIKLAGFNVETVTNGNDALNLLGRNHYDILMLDISLPDIGGLDLLKKLGKKPGLSVLVLSNMSDPTLIRKAMELGAASYIIKSTYTPQKVIEEVKSLLS